MPFKIAKEYVENLRRYATPIGCVWYFVTFAFRFVVISPIGRAIYADGLKEFTVNSKIMVDTVTQISKNNSLRAAHA